MADEKLNRKRKPNGDADWGWGKFDWNRYQWWRYTYVFRSWDAQIEYYRPYYDLQSHTEDRLEKARQQPDYVEVELYHTPDEPPFDFYIHYHNGMLRMLIDHFKEVFEERSFVEGHMPSNTYFRLILPKPIYHQILDTINQFGILPIRDLILEIIAIAQHKYVEDVAHWEKPEYQRIVNTAAKESELAIKLIEKTDDKYWIQTGKRPAELLHISFVFQDEVIKISHPWLAKEFIENFKKYYDKLAYKNWRLDLERYPERFQDNNVKHLFKYRLAKSLYNLLTKEGFFAITPQKQYPNDLMLCIARIIEFALIPVGDFEETDELKKRHIRNWLKRNEFEEAVTHLDLPADENRLRKYFDSSFIELTKGPKRADALSLAFYLGKRFEVDHLTVDFAHIAKALRELSFRISFQLLSDSRRGQSLFAEYDSLRTLVETLQQKSRIAELKFKLEGSEKEHLLTQRLPLHLLESALTQYMETHKEEFDTDSINSIYENLPDGGYRVQYSNQFNLPEERFQVRFVRAFYQFLLDQAPPTENDYMPSERYYKIIAVMLQKTWFFHQQMEDERDIVEKVKRWHKLGLTNENITTISDIKD